MMTPLFIPKRTFGPSDGAGWTDYVTWSGLTQLTELVSLDGSLCPTVLGEIKDDYWPHIVNADFMLSYFTDLEFMLAQLTDHKDINVLCVFQNPDTPPTPPSDILRFECVGYDLVELDTGISALSNCRGFPKAFANDELNAFGLLESHAKAQTVQAALREHYPDECHAYCDSWAVFRAVGD